MTYAAAFHFACLASQYTLTEDEIAATLRAARAQHPGEAVSLAAIEQTISDVLATREAHAA